MPPHDPELYDEALDRITRERAFMILAALKARGKINTADMIERLGDVLGDDQALGELIQCTARGENAFLNLIQKLALEAGEEQARADLADAPRRRREQECLERHLASLH